MFFFFFWEKLLRIDGSIDPFILLKHNSSRHMDHPSHISFAKVAHVSYGVLENHTITPGKIYAERPKNFLC